MENGQARKDELLQALDSADQRTRALFESLRDEDMSKKTDESNWSVGQLAGHVAQVPWAKYVLSRLSQDRNAAAPGPLNRIRDLGNWWNVRRFKSTSQAELLQTWERSFADYRAYVAALPDDCFDRGGEVAGRGHMTVAQFVQSGAEHTAQHEATIRKALDGGVAEKTAV